MDIGVCHEEANQLRASLSNDLSIEIPFDRGILYQLTKFLFKKWFINFEPLEENGVAYSKENLPKGWRLASFREFVSAYGGGGWGNNAADEKFTQIVKIVRGTDLMGVTLGEMADCPTRYIKESQLKSRILDDGDIVIEVSGGGKEQPTGRTTYITESLISRSDEPMIPASFCKLMRINAGIVRPSIAFLHLQYIYDERLIDKYEVQSTGIKNFKFEYFLDHEFVVVPPDPIQDRFHAVASKIFNLIHIIGAISEATEELVKVVPKAPGQLQGFANVKIRR